MGSPDDSAQRFERQSEYSDDRTSQGQDIQVPSRESLIRSYNAKDASRARNARMHSQEAMQSFHEREARARQRAAQREAYAMRQREGDVPSNQRPRASAMNEPQMFYREAQKDSSRRSAQRKPLSTKESHDKTLMSREAYEQERALRDVLSQSRSTRSRNREVIDGRGSIDSRAFNEKNEIVGYSIDGNDNHDPTIDSIGSKSKWRSHAGQGFASTGTGISKTRTRSKDLQSLSDTISGKSDYQKRGGILSTVPGSVIFLVVLIIVLLIVLVVLIFA